MQLIVTGCDESSSAVDELRKRHCAVAVMPEEALLETLGRGLDVLLVADAIVCFVDITPKLGSPAVSSLGETVVSHVRRLPDVRAMYDGRKWKALPVVLVVSGSGVEWVREELSVFAADESAVLVEAHAEFDPTFGAIADAVRDYRHRLLAELDGFGFLVSYEHGRYRVGPAMQSRDAIEGFLYYGPGDQRQLHRFFTVDRDISGVTYDVAAFEALINSPRTSEGQLQQFFEDHPYFLPNAESSLPLPHVRLQRGEAGPLIPDFILKPIMAYQRDSKWEVLDLKKPNARLLAGARHVHFSHDVTAAIAQVRNYRDYFQNPEHEAHVAATLGHRLRHPRLAVLIGRLQNCNIEALEVAQSRESDVRIVTYDEILQHQQHLAE